MYSGIREFHKSFCMSFAVQGNRTARKNLSARSMPYRSYLCMLMSNAPPALPELNMVGNGHRGEYYTQLKITTAVFTMPLLARFPNGKHAK